MEGTRGCDACCTIKHAHKTHTHRHRRLLTPLIKPTSCARPPCPSFPFPHIPPCPSPPLPSPPLPSPPQPPPNRIILTIDGSYEMIPLPIYPSYPYGMIYRTVDPRQTKKRTEIQGVLHQGPSLQFMRRAYSESELESTTLRSIGLST